MSIVLFGFKGCGKTHFGGLLAKELGRPLFDTDQIIEKREGLCCREIPLERFRLLENEVILSLPRGIIAVGGGSVLNPDNVRHLQTLGTLVYLEASKETLRERIFAQGIPSFLRNSSFEEMYAQRKPLYEQIPAKRIKTENRSDLEVLAELREIIDGKQ